MAPMILVTKVWAALVLLALLSVPALVGCGNDSDDGSPRRGETASGEAWALSVCRSILDPKEYQVLRARRLSADQAKALRGGFIPENGGLKPPKYMASCKVRILVPGIPQLPPDDAILVAEEGSSAVVVDAF